MKYVFKKCFFAYENSSLEEKGRTKVTLGNVVELLHLTGYSTKNINQYQYIDICILCNFRY